MAYEEPEYTVIETFDAFELRRYQPYVVAETRVTGDFSDIGSSAFRRLFAYISEEDRPQGEIAMTSPVIQQPLMEEGDAVAGDKSYRFAFVMPKTFRIEDLPVPEDAQIDLRSVPERLMAARRYSGTWSEARYRKNEEILLRAVDEAGFKTKGTPIFARYNAPFSLWFLRRNEVLIEIDSP